MSTSHRRSWAVLVASSFCPSIWWQWGCHCVMCLHFAAGWSWKRCSHKENQGAWKMWFAIPLHCSSFNYWDLGCAAVSQHVPNNVPLQTNVWLYTGPNPLFFLCGVDSVFLNARQPYAHHLIAHHKAKLQCPETETQTLTKGWIKNQPRISPLGPLSRRSLGWYLERDVSVQC